ncbi:MAG TPA: hypothetical protein VKU19_30545 [Bryobacteraceae bacterium]|nr:hypothetical protein [Bryobacteraceae bacterium]
MRTCFTLIVMATSLLAQSTTNRLFPGHNSNWIRFNEGGIAVEMPGTPEASTTRREYGDAAAMAHVFRYNKGTEQMLVSYMEFDRNINDVGYLQGVRDYFSGGQPMLRDKDLIVGGYRGKWMKANFQGKVTEVILVIVGRRVYQAFFQSPDMMTGLFDSPRFFGSFRIADAGQTCSFSSSAETGVYAVCRGQ